MEDNREAGLAEVQQGFWRRHRWAKWVAGGLLARWPAVACVVDVALHRAEPFLRARIVEGLAGSLSRACGTGQLSCVAGEWAVG